MVQCFYAVEIAVLAAAACLNFEPSGFFETTHDLADATIGQARFPSHAIDRRPAFAIVVGVIGQSQKDEPFGLIVWASIPDHGHYFDAHRHLLCVVETPPAMLCCAQRILFMRSADASGLPLRCGLLGRVERLPVLPAPIFYRSSGLSPSRIFAASLKRYQPLRRITSPSSSIW